MGRGSDFGGLIVYGIISEQSKRDAGVCVPTLCLVRIQTLSAVFLLEGRA